MQITNNNSLLDIKVKLGHIKNFKSLIIEQNAIFSEVNLYFETGSEKAYQSVLANQDLILDGITEILCFNNDYSSFFEYKKKDNTMEKFYYKDVIEKVKSVLISDSNLDVFLQNHSSKLNKAPFNLNDFGDILFLDYLKLDVDKNSKIKRIFISFTFMVRSIVLSSGDKIEAFFVLDQVLQNCYNSKLIHQKIQDLIFYLSRGF